MIFLSFLIFFVLSRKKKDEIVEMDGHRFRLSVLHRDPLETWVTLLSSQDLEGHSEANSEFDKAFEIGKGFLKFAYLDTAKNPNIPRRLKLKTFPRYCIFYTKNFVCVPTNISGRELVNYASYYLPDFSEKASLNWIKEDESNPVAILFTNKEETPSLWAAISNAYRRSNVRIGISNDAQLAKSLGIDRDFPVIVFHNYTHNIVYEGKNDFANLKSSIKKFVQKKFSRTSSGLFVRPISQYGSKFQGNDIVCIINIADDLDLEFEKIRKKYTTSMLEFFYGAKSEKLPVSDAKSGDVIVIFNEIGKYLKVGSLDGLEKIIPEIVSGKTDFANMQDLSNSINEDDGVNL